MVYIYTCIGGRVPATLICGKTIAGMCHRTRKEDQSIREPSSSLPLFRVHRQPTGNSHRSLLSSIDTGVDHHSSDPSSNLVSTSQGSTSPSLINRAPQSHHQRELRLLEKVIHRRSELRHRPNPFLAVLWLPILSSLQISFKYHLNQRSRAILVIAIPCAAGRQGFQTLIADQNIDLKNWFGPFLLAPPHPYNKPKT
ncbi:hypothetical protein F0562_029624 [Nyssa sinensis]|uniref:Uncharacterized protein n=1 Tax=Nyssa sinensis TaxID=561372 RepID=A0A5J5B3J4_9ASTE|nr:hypothetical protein F0562_029624 [Nyssa sinensis]